MGHIHTAWEDFSIEDAEKLIFQYDLNLALPMLFLEPETFRRRLYGKSSCIRFKNYGKFEGIEYRTLSNWFTSSEELISFVWDGITKSIENVNNGFEIKNWDLIAKAIDENNLSLAKEIMNENNVATL